MLQATHRSYGRKASESGALDIVFCNLDNKIRVISTYRCVHERKYERNYSARCLIKINLI